MPGVGGILFRSVRKFSAGFFLPVDGLGREPAAHLLSFTLNSAVKITQVHT